MRPNTRVKTPMGKGRVVRDIGTTKVKDRILVQLDEMVKFHYNFYFSKEELEILKTKR